MSVNSYLTRLAWRAIIREEEKERITRSISTLKLRLRRYFRREISEKLLFGSYTRGTILPRHMDENSDIDFMVVFADNNYRPQTYLDRLRRFVEKAYNRSEIGQSHPTIVLNLQHIRFELVSAVRNWYSSLQIPGKASGYEDWIETDPNGFNDELTQANQRHYSIIKRLVRVVKYWNVQAGKPFESYDLEQQIVGMDYSYLRLRGEKGLAPYFYRAIDEINLGWSAPQWKELALDRARNIVDQARSLERLGEIDSSERVIRRLLPMPTTGRVTA